MTDIPKLIVLSENMRGQIFRLEGDSFIVGRTEDNAISLPDGTISTHHAEVKNNGDGTFTVKDNNSTNGTRVNGNKITEQVISGSDVVQFGSIELLFDDGKERKNESVSRTAFDITQTAGTLQISDDLVNLNPCGSSKGGDSKAVKTAFFAIITLLLVTIVILLVMLLNISK